MCGTIYAGYFGSSAVEAVKYQGMRRGKDEYSAKESIYNDSA
jgi:hypothetical protein